MRRPVLALLATSLLGGCVGACGGNGRLHGSSNGAAAAAHSSRAEALEGIKKDADGDRDSAVAKGYDSDDYFGHAAANADRRAIMAVIERYYQAAASGDGQQGCRLLYSLLLETLPEEYEASAGGRPEATCATIMSSLFRRRHEQLALDSAKLTFAGVRVDGAQGWALVHFGTERERRLLVHREGSVWKVDSVSDLNVP